MLVARGQGRAPKGKGKKAKRKKYTARVFDKAAVDQFGYIKREVKIPGTIDSQGEIEEKAKAELAKLVKPTYNVTLTHPGIAFIRRGDAVDVSIPEEGISGRTGLMYVRSVVHNLSSDDYTMDLTLTYDDPLDPAKLQKEKDAAMRARKGATVKASGDDGGGANGPEKPGYPLAIHGTNLGGVSDHAARARGNWQSDNAVDIGAPLGTAVFAVGAGEVLQLGGSYDASGRPNPNGFNVTLKTSNNTWFYTHMRYRVPSLRVGSKVERGAFLGSTGAANSVPHLHIGSISGDPEAILGV